MSTDLHAPALGKSFRASVRNLVVPCGRPGFRVLGLAASSLGLHIWFAGSVLLTFVHGSEIDYLFLSANFGAFASSMLAAWLLVFGAHGLVRVVARRTERTEAPTGPALYCRSDVAWARPLFCFAGSSLALGNLVPGLAHLMPVLSYVVVDLRWWWTPLVAFWVLVEIDRRLGGALRARFDRAVPGVPTAVRRWAPAVTIAIVAAAWVLSGTPHLRFSPVAHGDEPKYLRYSEALYQGVGFQVSQLEPPADVTGARVWRNFGLLATELPGELRQLAADIVAFVADPSRRFNRAREAEANFLVGKNGGTYQKHMPGLSILMLPAYLVDRQLSGGGIATHWPPRLHAVNAFFLTAYVAWALLIFGVLRRLDYARPVAFAATLAVGLTMPMAAFPFQFYPEVVGGIVVFLLVGYALRPVGGTVGAFGAGALAGYLPWLHLRFGALAIVLAVAGGAALRRDVRPRWALAVGLAVVLACLSLYAYRITGSLVPTALYYAENAPSALSLEGAIRVGWAYILDRDWGVLAHAPVYLMALPGYWWLARRRRAAAWLCVLLPMCLILPAAGHTLFAGGTTPTRLIVAVVPLGAVSIAEVLARYGSRRSVRILFGLLLAFSLHNALAYNLHHLKHQGLLVDWSFSGWKTNLLFPAAARWPWEVSTANGMLLIAWFVVLLALVASPALTQTSAWGRAVRMVGSGLRTGTGVGALIGVTVFVLLGTVVSAVTGSWGASRYRLPGPTAAWEAAGFLESIDHCAICVSSRRGAIGTAAALAGLVDFGVYPRLCGGEAVIQLQAHSGLFVGAQRNRVRANADVAGRQERFTLMDANGGCVESGDVVSLRTADGYYLRSYGDRPRFDAGGRSTGPWERFVVSRPRGGVIRSRDTIALQTAYGYYVAAAQGAGGVLNANRTRVGPAARFTLTVPE